MDHHCTRLHVKPPEKRKHQVFLLAKYHSYFSTIVEDPRMKWEPDIWQILGKETGLDILSVAVDNTDGKVDLPSGIKSLGRLTREDFNEEVSSSLALVGVGHPFAITQPHSRALFRRPLHSSIQQNHGARHRQGQAIRWHIWLSAPWTCGPGTAIRISRTDRRCRGTC